MLSSLLQKIPLAIVGLLLLVAVVRIYIRSKNVTRSEFLKIFKSTRFVTIGILVFVFLVSGTFGILNYINSKQSVAAVLSLNYSEAS